MDDFVLGISAYYHDAAACLVGKGKIWAAAQEERFTRKKFDESFPEHAIRYCLSEAGITLSEVRAVVFYDKPLLKFERLLETYYHNAPAGFSSFQASMPIWLKDKLFLKTTLQKAFKILDPEAEPPLYFSEHHLSHAASTFYASAFEEAAVLTIDGVGEWATAGIYHGQGTQLKSLVEMKFPDSVGLLYTSFTYFLCFKVNSGEYKLMGLAPYGRPEQARQLRQKMEKELVTLHHDGSVTLHQPYFQYATGLRMIHEKKWEQLWGFPVRSSSEPLNQNHADLALAIQQFTEEAVIRMAKTAKELTGSKNLCLAGGVALNCVATGKLENCGIFENIYTQPASGDAGGALGAALAFSHLYLKTPRLQANGYDALQGSYLGPSFSEKEVENVLLKTGLPFQYFKNLEELVHFTASNLAEGKIIGWVQGRMEWGPRALGNRSILADPRNPKMQSILNLKTKHREDFRPFAPAVPLEYKTAFFESAAPSPYMTTTTLLKAEHRLPVGEQFSQADINTKLQTPKSNLPAITHSDFSARVQTVTPDTNERFWKLLHAFGSITGTPVLVNTSFNVNEEPIVATPADALRCFLSTEIDLLVLGNFVISKP
ncbi:carbamoyltransferase family protein [Rufibacter roseolus]|uniref:carbamoyltransferase family protein n=1 Tax=Rufibacter roseolus TaxID=2817375 RepID=UPI001B301AEE|nr:carbamoyltransferase N-terminal domain-containing protein [Rufibacter roseolus]